MHHLADPNIFDDMHHGFENLADDDQALSILSYGNGPGFKLMNTTAKGDWTNITRRLLEDHTAADVA